MLTQLRSHGVILFLLRWSSRLDYKLAILRLLGITTYNCESRVQHVQILVTLPMGVHYTDWGARSPRVLASILLVHSVEDGVAALHHEPRLGKLGTAVLAQLVVEALRPRANLCVEGPLRGQRRRRQLGLGLTRERTLSLLCWRQDQHIDLCVWLFSCGAAMGWRLVQATWLIASRGPHDCMLTPLGGN